MADARIREVGASLESLNVGFWSAVEGYKFL
jgi:hypothetical protein